MDIIRGFRDASGIKALVRETEKLSDRRLNIMEICGGQTHTIMRFGLNQLLPSNINFVHGPGCPVCVMPKERIDHAVIMARQDGVIVATLGDMMRVPGSEGSLIKERARGRDIRMVYSPLEVLNIAKKNPDKKVVYIAIGFETTTPMTAALIEMSLREGIRNIFFHINHVLVPPPIHAIMQTGDSLIDAFIGPGHVSVITGAKAYIPIVEKYRTPVVIAGFEPVDILEAILMILKQFRRQAREVEIQYKRGATYSGNKKAQELINRYFEVRESFRWRGIGDIPYSGLRIKDEFAALDAEAVFREVLPCKSIEDHKLCRCGEILRGKAKPTDCTVFGKACVPDNPFGACMVSGEGACHAYFKYGMRAA